MIRFSARGEYGIRMMMELARHYGKGPQSLADVARNEALPAPYLEQLVGKLRKAELVASHHGAHGGYELTRPPAEITVGEVMRVLEGPISPYICATEGASAAICAREPFCTANLVWELVRDSVARALDSLTLADLIPLKTDSPLWSAGHAHPGWDGAITLRPVDKTTTEKRRNALKV